MTTPGHHRDETIDAPAVEAAYLMMSALLAWNGLPSYCNLSDSAFHALKLDEWDPANFNPATTTEQSLSCSAVELALMGTNPLFGVRLAYATWNTTRIHAVIVGPAGTPYAGGFFHFLLQCPPTYPVDPPHVRHLNTGGNTVSFHPRLYKTGHVCHSILRTRPGRAWRSWMGIRGVLYALRSLLCQKPYFSRGIMPTEKKEPLAELYNSVLVHESIRVAVCYAIESCVRRTSRWPPELRAPMLHTFLHHYDSYVNTVMQKMYLTGRLMVDPLGHTRGLYEFKELLVRLRQLRTDVEDCLSHM
ncbi:hypothetical protein HPB50_003528 [Hyalomma asiaticum]|uniref:Uncharacterized protein n=1 Tax=Hyalomma asiaticum TaxID=266040 RepID=A0ACB7RXT3_HYAAI|nr:hypothetical protein HPB50_003528 [Hyalomma asiaticum]